MKEYEQLDSKYKRFKFKEFHDVANDTMNKFYKQHDEPYLTKEFNPEVITMILLFVNMI